MQSYRHEYKTPLQYYKSDLLKQLQPSLIILDILSGNRTFHIKFSFWRQNRFISNITLPALSGI